jgi:hypothetical protein
MDSTSCCPTAPRPPTGLRADPVGRSSRTSQSDDSLLRASSVFDLQNDPRPFVPSSLKRSAGRATPNGDDRGDRQCDVLSYTAPAGTEYPRRPRRDINGDFVAACGARGRHCKSNLMGTPRYFIPPRLKRPEVAHWFPVDEHRVPAPEVLNHGTSGDRDCPKSYRRRLCVHGFIVTFQDRR